MAVEHHGKVGSAGEQSPVPSGLWLSLCASLRVSICVGLVSAYVHMCLCHGRQGARVCVAPAMALPERMFAWRTGHQAAPVAGFVQPVSCPINLLARWGHIG